MPKYAEDSGSRGGRSGDGDAISDEPDWEPRYNIAPTQPVPVIRQSPKNPIREISFMGWGLIQLWSKDSSLAASMINARSETASTKPAFSDALKHRRGLIPARWVLRVETF
jgi:putative SOS response-associated peptidase YedK